MEKQLAVVKIRFGLLVGLTLATLAATVLTLLFDFWQKGYTQRV